MLYIIKGNSADLDAQITLSGDPYDLTNHQIWFTVKANRQSGDEAAYVQVVTGSGIEITNAASGFCTISLTPQQTDAFPASSSALECDIQIKTPEDKIYTVLFEEITITERVTHAFNQ